MALSAANEAEIREFSERKASKELEFPCTQQFKNDSPSALGVNMRDPDTLASAARSTARVATLRGEILEHYLD